MRSPLKILIIILTYFITVSSCKDEEEKLTACGVEDPLENLDWLKEKFGDPDSWGAPDIYYVRYQGADYIGIYYPPSSWGNSIRIYNCQGEDLCYSTHLDYVWCEIWVNCDKKVLLNP